MCRVAKSIYDYQKLYTYIHRMYRIYVYLNRTYTVYIPYIYIICTNISYTPYINRLRIPINKELKCLYMLRPLVSCRYFLHWVYKSRKDMPIPIQRSHNRSMFLLWCGFRHLKITLRVATVCDRRNRLLSDL
jgi:hypothetical protein